jgi:hypothetical protein
VVLVVIGVMLTKMNTYAVFPPTQNACPDHWDVSSNPNFCGAPIISGGRNVGRMQYVSTGSGITTTDPMNIGMCNTNSTFGCKTGSASTHLNLQTVGSGSTFQYVQLGADNPNWQELYPGKTALCAQNAWANMMNISWDGVKNYNGC